MELVGGSLTMSPGDIITVSHTRKSDGKVYIIGGFKIIGDITFTRTVVFEAKDEHGYKNCLGAMLADGEGEV
jgi:predicted metal-dependent enzyme (double-stranded beta helix superfamily)